GAEGVVHARGAEVPERGAVDHPLDRLDVVGAADAPDMVLDVPEDGPRLVQPRFIQVVDDFVLLRLLLEVRCSSGRRHERDEEYGRESDEEQAHIGLLISSASRQRPFVGAKRKPPSFRTMKPGVGKCAARMRTPESAWTSTNARRVARAFAGS